MAINFAMWLREQVHKWTTTRGYHAGKRKGMSVKAFRSDAYDARALGLGPIWKVHIRTDEQSNGDAPLVTLMLTDRERQRLIWELGGEPEDV